MKKVHHGLIIDFYSSLSFGQRKLALEILYLIINLPVAGSLYHRLYYRNIRKKADTLPTMLNIEACNICNLKCIMCPYRVMTRKKKIMSMELYRKIIDDAVVTGIKTLGLGNYGEPFIDEHLFDRIEYARRKGMNVGLTSNGTLLGKNDNVAKLMKSDPDWIEISVDGATKQTYEKIRVGAKFEDVVHSFTELVRSRNKTGHPQIYVNCVLQAANYSKIVIEKKQFSELFGDADSISFSPVDTRAGQEAWSLASKVDFRTPARHAHMYPCKRPFSTVTVLVDGSVALCCLDYDGKIKLGDLNVQSIQEVWNSERYREIRQLHLQGFARQISICRNCNSLYSSGFTWWRRL